MSKILRGIVLSSFLPFLSSGVYAEEKVLRESIEWSDVWVAGADQEGLPRVLLVGDSIARGYYDPVEHQLEGKARCARYTTSKFIGHADFPAELRILLDAYRFEVIHINSGLHGWAYSEEDYAAAFPRLLNMLTEHGRGATVIWATTTAVRQATNLAELDPKTERVRARNRIALDQMQARGVPVDDLFALVESRAELYSRDGTHFNDQGRAELGTQVAAIVSRYLLPPTRAGDPGGPPR